MNAVKLISHPLPPLTTYWRSFFFIGHQFDLIELFRLIIESKWLCDQLKYQAMDSIYSYLGIWPCYSNVFSLYFLLQVLCIPALNIFQVAYAELSFNQKLISPFIIFNRPPFSVYLLIAYPTAGIGHRWMISPSLENSDLTCLLFKLSVR